MAPLLNMRYEKERYNLKINKSILIFKITTSIVNETLEKKKKKKKKKSQTGFEHIEISCNTTLVLHGAIVLKGLDLKVVFVAFNLHP